MRTFAPRHNVQVQPPVTRHSPLFSLRRVTAPGPHSPDSVIPEPETRYGLSLARNDAFATIARSMFLTCTFASAPKTTADPFDSRLLRSVRFRGRTGAISTPGTRFPHRFPALPIHPRPPLPFRSSMEPSGSKRSTGSRFGKLTLPGVRLSLAPRRVLFRFRCGSTLQTRLALPGYRSVNPGTETDDRQTSARRQRKNEPNSRFQQLFMCLVFIDLEAGVCDFPVHKSLRLQYVWRIVLLVEFSQPGGVSTSCAIAEY